VSPKEREWAPSLRAQRYEEHIEKKGGKKKRRRFLLPDRKKKGGRITSSLSLQRKDQAEVRAKGGGKKDRDLPRSERKGGERKGKGDVALSLPPISARERGKRVFDNKGREREKGERPISKENTWSRQRGEPRAPPTGKEKKRKKKGSVTEWRKRKGPSHPIQAARKTLRERKEGDCPSSRQAGEERKEKKDERAPFRPYLF